MARKNDILSIYTKEVEQIKADGLFKGEAPFVSPQGAKVVMEDGRELLNMCANNYLGLGDSQRLIDAAKKTYDEKGYGVASVRFICGTQDIHKKLEKKIEEKETQLEELRALRFEPEYYHDYQKMKELDDKIDDVHNEIEHYMQKWEEYSEIMES